MPNFYVKIFIFLFCFIGTLQNTNALTPSSELKTEAKKYKLKTSDTKNVFQNTEKSSKKAIFQSKSTKSKTKKRKISFRKKLSILKLVLKSKAAKKHRHKTKQKKQSKGWNNEHTAGLVSWTSILITIMAFFTGHFLIALIFFCIALLAFILAFLAKGISKTAKIGFWFLIGLLLVLFFSVEFPLLTEFILYLL